MTDFITEPVRETPVSHAADLVVAGGGTAGIAAAVCAARMGLSVIMVENTAISGGMVTHVTQWLNDFDTKGGFAREFLEHLHEEGLCKWPYYNPYRLVPYFDDMLEQAGVRVLYLARVVAPVMLDDNRLGGVIIESKQGRTAILAKVVIDATGDGDVAAEAGADFDFGRPSDGAWQAISLSHLIMNYTGGLLGKGDFTEVVRKAERAAGLPGILPYDKGAVRLLPGTEAAHLSGLPHVTDLSPLSADELSDALIALRRQATVLFDVLKQHVEEFRGIEYGPFSGIPGVRESRRITCDATVTKDDILSGRKHDDGVITVTQSIDIHKCREGEPDIYVEKVAPYHIPYRALLPAGLEGLLVAGRCIGGEHEPVASYRIIADCFGMGEAAAIAASMAVEADCGLREIGVPELVAQMASRGYEL